MANVHLNFSENFNENSTFVELLQSSSPTFIFWIKVFKYSKLKQKLVSLFLRQTFALQL
jgi:hypothetical protein